MRGMTIGIVVPVHERADQLARLLTCLERQTSADFHVVVADDGSGPEVADLVAGRQPAWSGRLKRVACGPRAGLRIGRARNIGAANLPPDVTTLYFLDADMLVPRDTIAALARVTARHPEQVAYGPVDWLPEITATDLDAHVREDTLDDLRAKVPSAVPGTLPQQVDGTTVGPDIRFSLFGGLHTYDPDEPMPVRPYWSQVADCAVPRALYERLGGFDERVIGRGLPELAFGVALTRAGVTCLARPELWSLHQWHPRAVVPEEPAGFDLDAAVEQYGMPAGVFVTCLGGELA